MKGIGFVGVGCISEIYLNNITNMFKEIRIVGVCDLIRERAENGAAKYGVPKVYNDMYELFDDPEVDIVLNITRPYEHYEVTKAALLAGKNVYSEKPLSPDFEEAKELFELAKEKKLFLGGAPDTFMGAGIQTCRKLIDDGFIGTPIAAEAHFASHGPEHWHPDPEFVYQYGGGPMFDMGPYYVTCLINLLGKVDEICGMTKKSFLQRPILSQKKFGNIMEVEVPTHYAGVLRFDSGVIAKLSATFDVFTNDDTGITIFGTEGTLKVPDPNTFGGKVMLMHARQDGFESVPLLFNYTGNSRALGLADMAKSMETGRRHRANSEQQLHVVEIMSAFEKSSESHSFVKLTSDYTRSAPMKYTDLIGYLD